MGPSLFILESWRNEGVSASGDAGWHNLHIKTVRGVRVLVGEFSHKASDFAGKGKFQFILVRASLSTGFMLELETRFKLKGFWERQIPWLKCTSGRSQRAVSKKAIVTLEMARTRGRWYYEMISDLLQ